MCLVCVCMWGQGVVVREGFKQDAALNGFSKKREDLDRQREVGITQQREEMS